MLSELEALSILSTFPIGAVRLRQLIHYFGSPLEILNATPSLIESLPSFNSKLAVAWHNWKDNPHWQTNLKLIERYRVKLIPYFNPDYPKNLLDLPDAPLLLYVQGKLTEHDQTAVSIVGTRQATAKGKRLALETAALLAASGFTVISGLAKGIDTEAHKSALLQGRTIAVLGSGLANLYPKENISLAQSISKKGAVISEFPMYASPDRQNFPQRNRIIAGLGKVTILIEAPIKSGAMLAMQRGERYGRPLLAFQENCPNSGNSFLIQNHRATPVSSAEEILDYLKKTIAIELSTY